MLNDNLGQTAAPRAKFRAFADLQSAQATRGKRNYRTGLGAEAQVARHYETRGATILAQRWRRRGGEIDLIISDNDAILFVEVKCARSHDQAAASLSGAQQNRIYAAAQEYLSDAAKGAGLESSCRFDVALVDGTGRIKIIENAICH